MMFVIILFISFIFLSRLLFYFITSAYYVWAASVDGLVPNLAARHSIHLQCLLLWVFWQLNICLSVCLSLSLSLSLSQQDNR